MGFEGATSGVIHWECDQSCTDLSGYATVGNGHAWSLSAHKTGAAPAPAPKPPATTTTKKAPADRAMSWAMPDRLGLLDGRGMVRYSRAKPDQKTWPVDFTLPGCEAGKLGSLTWLVDGRSAASAKTLSAKGCKVAVDVGTLGKHHVAARAPGAGQGYAADVVARDFLILGLGDSVASGEGNPDVTKQAGGPLWQEPRCDRSAGSFEARAALAVEQHDSKTSVSFLHLACSGAAIRTGVIGAYWGITPGDANLPLSSQVASVRKQTAGRPVDAAIISIGANDLGFGDVLEFCVFYENCQNRHYKATGKFLSQVIKAKLAGLPALYAELAGRLEPLVAANRVYINLYPDELRDGKGAFCDDIINYHGVRAIRANEAKWMFEDFMTPLNAAIVAAARAHGWNVIAGAPELFRTHGYCAGAGGWVVTYDRSSATQGNTNGTMHPNPAGHEAMGELAARLLVRDLFGRG